MGGSSAPATTTQVTKTELPAWLEGTTKENIAIADQISKRPYQQYGGQLTAGYAPEQLAALQYAQEGVGMTTPLYQRAAIAANDAASFTPQQVGTTFGADQVQAGNFLNGNINAYMNPFTQNVENAALQRLDTATRMGVNRISDQARQARAFGGSRQGLAEGAAIGEAARSAGELSANLRSQAFNTGAQLMQADQNRAMQAALANQGAGMQAQQLGLQAALANQSAGLQGQQLGLSAASQLQNIAQGSQQARSIDAAALEAVGSAKQSQQQQMLDEAYSRWLEARNYPIEMLNLRLGATTATPYAQTQTTTGTRTGGGSGSNFLSGLGTAASIGASLATIAGVF